MHALAATDAQESARDRGLVRAVGPGALAAGALSSVVGAGIFAVPSQLAANVGSYGPMVLLACGFAIGAVAVCFAEGGSRVPTSGGVYGPIEAAFGPFVGYLTGTLLWVAAVLACGGVAAALADIGANALSRANAALVRPLLIVAVIGSMALINIGGVARGMRLIASLTALKLLPLILFVGVGLGAVHALNLSPARLPASGGLGHAMLLALYTFAGMETALCASGEVREPNRTIPRALALAMIATTLLYVAIQVTAQGILGQQLAHSTVPLADAMARIHPLLRVLMLVAAALSMLGWMSVDILGSPRQLFAFARDGLLPRALGRVQARSHVPHVAILWYAAMAAVLALTGSFAELAVLSGLATAPLYIAGCAAAWKLARRGTAIAGPPLAFPFIGAAAVVGILSMAFMMALATRAELLGLASLLVVAGAVYLVQTRRRAGGTVMDRQSIGERRR
jgi:amino acid transporter